MRYDNRYNRIVADRMFEWESEEWIIDHNGNLKLRDELTDDSGIESVTISPLYSTDSG